MILNHDSFGDLDENERNPLQDKEKQSIKNNSNLFLTVMTQ